MPDAAPYREEAPRSRYALRTPWSRAFGLAAREIGLAIVLDIVVFRVAVSATLVRHRDEVPSWLLGVLVLLPVLAVALWLMNVRRFLVRHGTTLELYDDRIAIVAPGSKPRVIALSSPGIEITMAPLDDLAPLPLLGPTNVILAGEGVRFEVSPLAFETPTAAARFASDVARLREGKAPLDHDAVGAAAVADARTAKQLAAGRDDLDARLDAELARMRDSSRR